MKDSIIIFQFSNPCDEDSIELDQIFPICDICGEHSAMIEVRYHTHNENVCMGCYAEQDYQRIVNKFNPKRFLI